MTIPDGLSKISSIIYGDGTPMTGCQLSDEEAMQWVRERYSNMEYCLVREWCWLDIDVSDEARDGLKKRALQPVVVYANNVVYDSRRRWDTGSWVKTSLLHRYDEGGAFMTFNSVYVLLGEGTRQTTTPEALRSLI
ncbi:MULTISPECIES: DUF6957 family protein [Pseudomonas]|uniref:DUF6957 domain-containing protein n=1 Tax=Pseudomonas multiresinivorans TaxID=95301 RepID=A0A7Z3BNF2_9PSED|nr:MULTISPECIES: hypothetical protein [Pseudomonas]MCG8910327.1 hypothetical protein [Pseudomonas sp. DP-17]QJP09971.1 hypothetical protein G4G71_19520 [Pseudomonas multiresinivorans]